MALNEGHRMALREILELHAVHCDTCGDARGTWMVIYVVCGAWRDYVTEEF